MNQSHRLYHKLTSQIKILPYKVLHFSDDLKDRFLCRQNPPQAVINHLQTIGYSSTSHMNPNLFEHFNRTYRILKKWDNNESVCLAGLYHAIYGAGTFHEALVSLKKREDIALLIGDEGKNLVYYYSILSRSDFVQNIDRKKTIEYYHA